MPVGALGVLLGCLRVLLGRLGASEGALRVLLGVLGVLLGRLRVRLGWFFSASSRQEAQPLPKGTPTSGPEISIAKHVLL